MKYTPRTIAFLCDLLHPPIAPDPRAIQRLHNIQFEKGDPAYNSYNVTHEGALLSNPVSAPGANSSVAFLADRIRFREELSGLTVETFSERVRTICEAVITMIPIQIFTAQQVTVRTLINPRHFPDSREFIKTGMFGFDNQMGAFAREPQLYGMRMVFPPSPQDPNAHALRIESFHSDPRSLFVENQASFGPTILQNGLSPIQENVNVAYRFVVDRSLNFLAQFDAHQEA
ncbi:MAG: hypothetical protein ACI8TQ_000025 [Planctomycetota bacterium]|jgi:hypothetical protein